MVTAALTLGAISTPVFADVPGRNWISKARVSHILASKGYRVTKLEADDGHWEGDAVRRGAKYEFHFDAHSGRITKLERDHD